MYFMPTDIDECPNTTCNANSVCYNTIGSYKCVCGSGYEAANITRQVCIGIMYIIPPG